MLTEFCEETHVNITSSSTTLPTLSFIGYLHNKNIFLQTGIASFYSTNARSLATSS